MLTDYYYIMDLKLFYSEDDLCLKTSWLIFWWRKKRQGIFRSVQSCRQQYIKNSQIGWKSGDTD